MNTCDTCKWWMDWKEEGGHVDSNGIPYLVYAGRCDNPKVNFRGTYQKQSKAHLVPADIAGPEVADDCGLCFLTGPKFGCVHHEPK